MDLMPFDAINRLENELPIYFENGKIRSKVDLDDIIDDMFGVFLLSYARGANAVNPGYKPTLKTVMETIDEEVDGKTWRDRMKEHYESGGTMADVVRIIETEAHRDSNAGAYKTAKAVGAKNKTWHTMEDNRVRDTHVVLDEVTAPIDGYFYTYTGERAQAPGQFGSAAEDCNCRCFLTFK